MTHRKILSNFTIVCVTFRNCPILFRKNKRSRKSRIMRKQAFCICENKDADQLRGNREADQCLCFRNTDSTIPLLPKSKVSNL